MENEREYPLDIATASEIDERQIVEAAKNDATALSALYRLHYSAIYGYVIRRIGNAHDANDVVADVFVEMVRYLPRYRWTGAPFRCWLLRIAITQINRWARRRKWTRLWQPIDDAQQRTQILPVLDERLEAVRIALSSLPDPFRTVLELHYFEDLQVDSIAFVMNCRPGTVKSRLSRGRESLRTILSKTIRPQEEEKPANERKSVGILLKEAEV